VVKREWEHRIGRKRAVEDYKKAKKMSESAKEL
jgi:hypothetical protein